MVELKELLSAKDQDGYTALHRAAYGGHVEVLQVNKVCTLNNFRR